MKRIAINIEMNRDLHYRRRFYAAGI